MAEQKSCQPQNSIKVCWLSFSTTFRSTRQRSLLNLNFGQVLERNSSLATKPYLQIAPNQREEESPSDQSSATMGRVANQQPINCRRVPGAQSCLWLRAAPMQTRAKASLTCCACVSALLARGRRGACKQSRKSIVNSCSAFVFTVK